MQTGLASWLLPTLLVLTRLAGPIASEAATIWTGPRITKSDADGPDQITALVALTRGSTQGLYNSVQETGFTHFLSPKDTEWANGTTANTNLPYTDWNTWAKNVNGGPPFTVGVNAVVHLKTDDIYIDIKFLSWSTAGPYSYERSTPPAANVPPSVSITNPADGASFMAPTTVTIQATASDSDGSVTNVQFFDGASSLGSVATSPYNITIGLALGSHTLTAVASDNLGATTTSAPVTVTVANNSPPSVSITNPVNGTTMTTPTNVTIQASASDTDGTVVSVQFFDGTNSLGTEVTSPYSVSVDLYPGSHPLTALATDNLGASSTSAVVTVTVSSVVITNPIAARIPKGDITIELQTIADGMASPLSMAVPDDGSGRMFVYDQAGTIWLVTASGRSATPVLDVRARLNPSAKYSYDERGFLGLVTHPNFALHPLIYTYTSESNSGPADFPAAMPPGVPDHQSVIAEWRMDATITNRVDPASRREVLRIDKPQSNHNGGTMRFGPDGFLYFCIGDGGNANDVGNGHLPGGNAQSTMMILGKLHRIDVDGTNSANGKYGIPLDNPFDGTNGLREIFCYGLRNPFSYSFDRLTGQIYEGDVGQNKVEEVNILVKGGNYGWNLREGPFWFDSSSGNDVTAPVRPVPPGLIEPIAAYDHDDGLAVIGGFVYRGTQIPALYGRYVFADWGTFTTPTGRLLYLDAGNNIQEFQIGLSDRPLGLWVKGWGEGPDGEFYVFGSRVVGPAGNTGKMLKIVPGPAPLSVTSITPANGTNVTSGWAGGQGPYALQQKSALTDPTWINKGIVTQSSLTTTLDGSAGFFRVVDTAHQRAIPLSVSLTGAGERPTPLDNTASGFGLASLDGNTLAFNVRYSGLSGPAVDAHIHGPATTATSAGVQIDLAPYNGGAFGSSGTLSGMIVVSDAQKAMILAGQAYINLHTASNPGGEIRGQIAPVLMQVALSDANEHPALASGASGLGVLTLVSNQLTFNLTYQGLSGPATAAHIHGPASMTQDAGVLVDLQPYNGGAFGSQGTLLGTITLTPDQLAAVIDGQTYINFHTAAHPGGEMRGQIVPQATAVPLTAPLTGLSERPTPLTNSAAGAGFFSLEGNTLTFSLSYGGLSGVATAAHIHGPASSAGTASVIVDFSPFNGGAFGSSGTLSGVALLTSAQRDMVLSGQTYVNVHTAANPGGEMRGQLAPVLMRTYLSGAEERPTPVFSGGTALGIVALVLNQLTFDITYSGLSSVANGSHIHGPATVTQTAGILVDLGPFNGGAFGTAGSLVGAVTLIPSQLASVVDQLTYMNIHTANFSGGEIRGQILP